MARTVGLKPKKGVKKPTAPKPQETKAPEAKSEK